MTDGPTRIERGRVVDDDERLCEFVIFRGSPNPESARFGPDEMCEDEAEPGQDYCAAHLPWTED